MRWPRTPGTHRGRRRAIRRRRRSGASGRGRRGRRERARARSRGMRGKGRELLPTWACDEVVVHWPARCGCGHAFADTERVAVADPVRHQVEELPQISTVVVEHQCPRVRCPGGGRRHHVTPLWFIWTDGASYVTSISDRPRLRRLAANPRAGICVDIEEGERDDGQHPTARTGRPGRRVELRPGRRVDRADYRAVRPRSCCVGSPRAAGRRSACRDLPQT